ncbi:hypothetical protein BP5796_01971 [Coleophoma crateriformis]|uniref:S-adenosyl-L-methionine-dependent methyltransferase n=1 Tax=Coleophoma crateriformis TaxID=565419 RepID=A0A3D8T1X2_9HELO|nr:hypothetical protein BP5796_01971 [Coleophoma crateriformis]
MAEFAAKNRDYFNNEAAQYNGKFEKTIQAIMEEIQQRLDWIGVDWASDTSSSDGESSAAASSAAKPSSEKKTVRLLDYACGTGLVSRALAPYLTQSIGVDVSENMVQVYNTGAENQGIPTSEMRAIAGDLLDPANADPESLSSPELYDFDIAAVGLGFHHFEDPGFAAKQLSKRLKSGGVLFIIDFLPHAGHGHGHGHGGKEAHGAVHTVKHLGFSEQDVKTMFEEAGCGEGFEYVVVGKGIVFRKQDGEREEMKRSVFMARGRKA